METAAERLVESAAQCAAAARELGFPVVLKGLRPGVAHKSDEGLVRLGVRTANEAAGVFAELGCGAVLVQRQVAGGVEMIVGITRDPTLGAAVLVGLGGIHAEVLHDTSVRPLPVTAADVAEMPVELRGHRLLEGVRGAPPCDTGALVRTVLAVADLAADPVREIVELDLNPVIVGPAAAVAVDSLVVIAAR